MAPISVAKKANGPAKCRAAPVTKRLFDDYLAAAGAADLVSFFTVDMMRIV